MALKSLRTTVLDEDTAGYVTCITCTLFLLLRIGYIVWKQFTMWVLKWVAGHQDNTRIMITCKEVCVVVGCQVMLHGRGLGTSWDKKKQERRKIRCKHP